MSKCGFEDTQTWRVPAVYSNYALYPASAKAALLIVESNSSYISFVHIYCPKKELYFPFFCRAVCGQKQFVLEVSNLSNKVGRPAEGE